MLWRSKINWSCMYVDKDINVKKMSHWGNYVERKKARRRSKKLFLKTQQSNPFNNK